MEAVSPRGARDIPANEFFTGLWENAMASDEILTAVRFPVWGARSGFAVEEFARRHGDFAIAGAAVAVQLDDDARVTRCGIGLLGLGSTPLRGSPAEEAVVGRAVGDITADEVGRLAISALIEIPADLQGSAAYRAKVGATMVARAWESATAEASNA
jgi:carbon-monoxide dehydrogenase medium subunit